MHIQLPRLEVVLLGIGHTNAHVLRMWRMDPLPGSRLTCVSNHPVATYSGMLPGVLAGQYSAEQMEIDLVRGSAAARARFILGHVTGLDRVSRELRFDDRPPLPFDVLSIGIGSVPKTVETGRGDDSMVAIKPMQTFLSRLEKRLDQVVSSGATVVRLAIVGGGAGGVEVALCLEARLRLVLGHVPFKLTLISAVDPLIPGVSNKTSSLAHRELERRGVDLILGQRVTGICSGTLSLESGAERQADVVVWATNAVGAPLLAKFGLAMDSQGFLLTRPTLQTLEDDAIFAVGDAGTIQGQRFAKAGVYAVRQGPVMWQNLRRWSLGEPLHKYRPQNSFLKLFNTGDGRAIGEYQGMSGCSPWLWELKNWIDSRFMAKYQDYTLREMATAAEDLGPAIHDGRAEPRTGSESSAPNVVPLADPARERCLGCGGKIGSSVLARALAKLDVPSNEHVVVGLQQPDDATVIRVPTGRLISLSVDFFAAPLDDLFLVGRIAALNSASDSFAMGAKPIVALASVTLPVGPPHRQEQMLYELLAGALHELRPMGATLAGGHTIEGAAPTIGFSMLAVQDGAPRIKGQLRAGQLLVLTKPLGIGVLLAAHMQAKCRAEWWEPLVHAMLLSNQYAAELCHEFEIQATTDVTGFGLAGHLVEMLRPSGVGAEIYLRDVPLLPGAEELLQQGLESTLAPANRIAAGEIHCDAGLQRNPHFTAMFDPQTSGGLLLGVPSQHVKSVLARLAQQSAVPAAVIGRVLPRTAGAALLRVADSAWQ